MLKKLKIPSIYIPLLIVYFAAGFMGLASVSYTFFIKDHLTLTAEALISIGIWTGLPWTVKMLFGALIDSVPVFGSQRKGYVYLGSIFTAVSILGMVYIFPLIASFGEYDTLLAVGLLGSIGAVFADIAADTMAIELVPEDHPERLKELGQVQVYSRLAITVGGLLAAVVTGYLASHYQATTVFALQLVNPALMVVACFGVTLPEAEHATRGFDKETKQIFIGGLLYAAFCICVNRFGGINADELLFFGSLLIVGGMFALLTRSIEPEIKKLFIFSMIAIFLFRVVPGVGPAGSWWYMTGLKFDESFMGTLRLFSSLSSFVALLIVSRYITKGSLLQVMCILIGLDTILSLPDILVFYHINDLLHIPVREFVLIDATMASPLAGLSMIPLGVLVANAAPKANKALYMSLTASLMNLALIGSDVITKRLNHIFIVTRTDFAEMGHLLVTSLSISFALSLIGLALLARYHTKTKPKVKG